VDCTLFLNLFHFLFCQKQRGKKKETQVLGHENKPASLALRPHDSQAWAFIGILSAMGFGHVNGDKMR
jgi:hypothetical protein